MSENDYTPTAEHIANVYECKDDEFTDSADLYAVRAEARQEFYTWLAAHDAAKRAEWEAEQGEVEWEYGSEGVEGTSDPDPRPLTDDKPYWPESLEGVREPNAEQAAQIVAKWNEGDPESCHVIRRRKAGPWESVGSAES